MQRFERSFATPAENVAFDEAILEWAENQSTEGEFLRLWESADPMVVVGRSSHVEKEVNVAFCRHEGIPVLRRSSGGAAIVAGPGCLMYAVVLNCAVRTELKDISRAHSFVLTQLTKTIGPLVLETGTVACAGTSDLVLDGGRDVALARKFSGNSLRVKRTHLLYHGTLLYDFDLPLIEKCLRTPPRQPEYRKRRDHSAFIVNLPASRQQLIDAVTAAFPMACPPDEVPRSHVEKLVAERFSKDEWNYEFK
jgi:lipoate-protein ligase A